MCKLMNDSSFIGCLTYSIKSIPHSIINRINIGFDTI